VGCHKGVGSFDSYGMIPSGLLEDERTTVCLSSMQLTFDQLFGFHFHNQIDYEN